MNWQQNLAAYSMLTLTGSNVQNRLSRAINLRLSLATRHNMQRHLALMKLLLSWPLNRPVQIFVRIPFQNHLELLMSSRKAISGLF